MMISSKVVLTYKRKRKLSILESAHGVGFPNSCSKSPSDKLSTVLGNNIESSDTYLQESQIGDPRCCVKCVSCDVGEKLLCCHICSETYHLQCIDPPLKHIPRGQWLCPTCVKERDSGKCLQQRVHASRRVKARKLVDESDLGPITLSSHKVLQTTRPSEATPSPTETDGSVQTDESPEKKSDYIHMGLSSNMNPVPECQNPLTDESSILPLINIETEKKSSSECLGASIERDCTFGCTSASMLLVSASDNTDSPLKDNSDLLSGDGPQKNKFSTPVITFSRRDRKKKNVNDYIQNQLVKEEETSVAKWSNTACGLGCSYEDASHKCSSVSQLSTLILLKEDPETVHLAIQRQDKNKNKDASSTSTFAGGVPETKMCVEQDKSTQGCPSEDGSSIIACVPCLTSHQHLSSWHPELEPDVQVEPKKCIEASSADVTDLKVINEDRQSELPKVGSSNVEHSQIMSSDGVKEAIEPDDVSRDDSRGAEENTTNEQLCSQKPLTDSAAETLGDSANSVDPNHVTVLPEVVPQRGKIGESFKAADDMVQETLSSRREFMSRKTCIYIEEDDNNYHGKDLTMLSMGISSEDPCKQSCNDEEISQMHPPPCIPPDSTACVDLEERTFISQSGCERNQYNKMTIKSSLCPRSLDFSLPSNPAINFFKDFPSMPTVSNFGLVSSCIPEMSIKSASDKSTFSLRHKQMLENIITRAGSLRGSSGSSLDKLKGCTKKWSEEELDFLWVGVRRHGKGNWDAILRDPRLCFSEFRVAADLAGRWDLEQSKLLDTSLGINSGFLSRKGMVGSRCCSYQTEGRSAIGSQALIDETRLSLGDVYLQREVNALNRFTVPGPFTAHQTVTTNSSPENVGSISNSVLTHSVLQRIGSKQLQTPCGRQRNRSRSYSNYRRPRYDMGLSILQQKPIERSTVHDELGVGGWFNSRRDDSLLRDDIPTGFLAEGNLPHWLREVVNEPPSRPPLESVLLPNAVSAGAQSVNLLHNNYHRFIPPCSHLDTVIVPPMDPHQRLDKNNSNSNLGGLQGSDIPNSVHSANISSMRTNLGLLSRWGSSSVIPPPGNLFSNYSNAPDLSRSCSYPVTRPNDLIIIDSDASSEETISDDQSGRL
ncbi:zinc finger protein [Macleaya cordata]|uniref:Zinc finger protein n=1 Tax=Macleaya cordata TaxID=56857 RepID=A0A200PTL8_MACCD|nr:zinc finger protein [Macleaya cordata]